MVHFLKCIQWYPLKSMHAEPRNSKEHDLFFLRKYRIQIVNGASRSPQTQGLLEQANGMVEGKLRAWKMENVSTEWADGLLEVTLAMNTQNHLTIRCAPAELLFRNVRHIWTGLIATHVRILLLEQLKKILPKL
jgi:hypothetical protein